MVNQWELLKENTIDASKGKHVPVIEGIETGVRVKIGSVPHLNIEWIEIVSDGKSYKKFLKPDDKPEAEFKIEAKMIEAREYCNLHGLWKS